MKVLAKIERIIAAIGLAMARYYLMVVGAYGILYEMCDYEYVDFVVVFIGGIILYCEIKHCVFKCISIIKG